MLSPRRHRLLLAGCVSLSIVSGCFNPAGGPGATGGEKRTAGGSIGNGTTAGNGASAGVGSTTAGPSSTVSTAATSSNTSPVSSNNGEPSGVRPPGSTRAPVDPKVYLVGRVLVPPGILSNNGGNVIGQNGGNIVSNNGGNVIGQNGGNIVSNNGGNVIGQNGGNIIGQNGGNVIGQNGGNVIGQNGGNVIGQNGGNIISNNGGSFRLGQRPLAYASIRVADAAGKPRLDKAGNEIVVQADEEGQYVLPRDVVSANSILRVTSPAIQGELKAFVARGGEGVEQLDVDAVSSLTSTYILERFVDGKQEVLDRLTKDIEAEARDDVTRALQAKSGAIVEDLTPIALVSSVSELIGQDAEVADVIVRIEKLLIIAGITNDGEGLPATTVPFAEVSGMLATSAGTFIFSQTNHRLSLVANDGRVYNVVSPGNWPYQELRASFNYHSGMVYHNGWLYLADTYCHRIIRIKQGKVEVIAGNGSEAGLGATVPISSDGSIAKNTPIGYPTGLAMGSDGSLYFSESFNDLVRRVTPDGIIETIAGGGATSNASGTTRARDLRLTWPQGLSIDSDGYLYIADRNNSKVRRIDLNTGESADIVNHEQIWAPHSVAVSDSGIFVGGQLPSKIEVASGGWRESIVKIKDGIVSNVTPGVPNDGGNNEPHWLGSTCGLTTLGGQLIYQDWHGVINSLDLSAVGTRKPLAGFKSGKSVDTLRLALSLAVNDQGDIAIADHGSDKIYVKRNGDRLQAVAGNGESGFIERSDNALAVPLDDVWDVEWDGPNALLFSIRNERPSIQRVEIGGGLTTIRDHGVVEPIDFFGATLFGKIDLLRSHSSSVFAYHSSGVLDDYKGNGRFETIGSWKQESWPVYMAKLGNEDITLQWRDKKDLEVLAEGTLRKAIAFRDIDDVADDSGYWPAVIDASERVFIAGNSTVSRFDLRNGTSRVIAGKGGVIFNNASRDESLSNVRDLAFTPAGDLLVLEYDQLKVIPKAVLSAN